MGFFRKGPEGRASRTKRRWLEDGPLTVASNAPPKLPDGGKRERSISVAIATLAVLIAFLAAFGLFFLVWYFVR